MFSNYGVAFISAPVSGFLSIYALQLCGLFGLSHILMLF